MYIVINRLTKNQISDCHEIDCFNQSHPIADKINSGKFLPKMQGYGLRVGWGYTDSTNMIIW